VVVVDLVVRGWHLKRRHISALYCALYLARFFLACQRALLRSCRCLGVDFSTGTIMADLSLAHHLFALGIGRVGALAWARPTLISFDYTTFGQP
jgi:hypothetical protein